MEREDLPWRSFAARGPAGSFTGGSRGSPWRISATPTLFLLDSRGVIRRKWVGNPGTKALEAALEALLEEAERGAPGEKEAPGSSGKARGAPR